MLIKGLNRSAKDTINFGVSFSRNNTGVCLVTLPIRDYAICRLECSVMISFISSIKQKFFKSKHQNTCIQDSMVIKPKEAAITDYYGVPYIYSNYNNI